MNRVMEREAPERRVPWVLGGGIAGAAAGVLALDLFNPLGNGISFLYLAVVYFALRLPRWRYAAAAGASCTVLIVVGGVFSPPSGVWSLGVLHRAVTIAVMWAFLALEKTRHETDALRHVARRRAERLAAQLLRAQEGEREGLARALHDEIGQVLTAAAINVERARAACAEPQPRQLLGESIAELEGAVERVRELALELRPSLLDDLGLGPALEWYLQRQAERGGLALEFEAALEGREVPASVAIVCYRVAQEAMTNVLRHAKAKRVAAQVSAEGEILHFTLRDDGAGFDVEEALARRGAQTALGLAGMQERAAAAGGAVTITSSPGAGTEVSLELPLAGGA